MKKLFFLLPILPVVLFGCSSNYNGMGFVLGEGPVVRRTLDLDPFEGIKLSISADVTITQGDQQLVEVEGQDNLIDLITTEVQGGVWRISSHKNFRNNKSLRVYITLPRLSSAGVSGSGNITGTNIFNNSEELDLAVSGSGNISLEVEAGSIEAGISGSGDMELRGNTQSFGVGISGSGDVEALNLTTAQARIRISGSGDVEIHVTEELDASISGSGDVRYRGQPRAVKARSSGSGDIEAI
jgi:hypothetical protein